ncbi:hypothetical protein [Prochlorococcus sp. MIT 1300]|uniref:hypothetical protein n=1 Tax=Prochlorococcus sp. MIT 1300 TaxID=3096218 RepID=UPI002A766BF1|nr:hypothetical protein [Prochlorococcus sp. MIT 1300]
MIKLFIASLRDIGEYPLDQIQSDKAIELNYMASPSNYPWLMIGLGAILTIICGIFFARNMQSRLIAWENDGTPPLPLSSLSTNISWTGAFIGITFFFGGILEILNFSPEKSLISSFLISFSSGIIMWALITDLMKQVQSGTIREIDKYL